MPETDKGNYLRYQKFQGHPAADTQTSGPQACNIAKRPFLPPHANISILTPGTA